MNCLVKKLAMFKCPKASLRGRSSGRGLNSDRLLLALLAYNPLL